MSENSANPLTLDTDIDEIVENFQMLEEWDDRYGYLIELGRALKDMPEGGQSDTNKVNGCVSQVWVAPIALENGTVAFRGASDAHIVSGLVAIALSLFSGKQPKDIVAIDEQETFKSIGLAEHLTPQRSNGLRAMVERIKALAQAAS